MSSLPLIKDPAVRKFCQERSLGPTLALAYQYAHKYYPTATIDLELEEPYCGDAPEDYRIVFSVETDMTIEEAIEAKQKFHQAVLQLPGGKYMMLSPRFID
jgi:hypothetical protein